MAATAMLGVVMLTVFSFCGPNQPPKPGDPDPEPNRVDPVASILKDLKPENYLVEFDNSAVSGLIKSGSHGDLSDLFMIPNPDAPEVAPRFPVKLIFPTCFRMLPDFELARRFAEILQANKIPNANDIRVINTGSGGLLVSDAGFKQFSSFKADKFDTQIMKGVDGGKVLFLTDGDFAGLCERPFHGWADLLPMFPKKKIKDIFPPKMRGCYDIKELLLIKTNLAKFDKAQFGNLAIDNLPGGGGLLH